MKKVIQILNALVADGVIEKYAIGGAVGVLFYTETLNTKDVDVFVAPNITTGGVVHLGSIYDHLKKAGYEMNGQYFMIGGIPVDLIPAYNDLTMEALDNSVDKLYDKMKVKVFRPEYLLAIALQTGRSQDFKKVDLLASETKMDKDLSKSILKRYGLYGKWRKYDKGR